ncbi:Iron-sulfur cluster assembly protein CyaY [compost metagenome]
MMTIKFDNGSQLILSRQEPLRQLWLAARSGGYHFDYDEESGKWTCEKTEELLGEILARAAREQAGLELDFEEI